MRIVTGPVATHLGAQIARELGGPPIRATWQVFPDGEAHVVVSPEVGGQPVALVQSLSARVGEGLLELALLADACRRAGATEQVAVLPYLPYARQDRCSSRGEGLGGEVVARMIAGKGFEHVVAVDLHSDAAIGWFGVPVHHVSALPALAGILRPALSERFVVVSPDLGGVKRAERVARVLGLPLAVVHKRRRGPGEVEVHRVLGDVRDRGVVIVDDMISTGGTILAAANALRQEGCTDEVFVLATHALLVGDAVQRLASAGIRLLAHSDSVAAPRNLPFPTTVVPLAPLLATTLRDL